LSDSERESREGKQPQIARIFAEGSKTREARRIALIASSGFEILWMGEMVWGDNNSVP
jgi:hypothetical protein